MSAADLALAIPSPRRASYGDNYRNPWPRNQSRYRCRALSSRRLVPWARGPARRRGIGRRARAGYLRGIIFFSTLSACHICDATLALIPNLSFSACRSGGNPRLARPLPARSKHHRAAKQRTSSLGSTYSDISVSPASHRIARGGDARTATAQGVIPPSVLLLVRQHARRYRRDRRLGLLSPPRDVSISR